jgi:outer membrane protein OmpA-like peptidoglycan-associated protein
MATQPDVLAKAASLENAVPPSPSKWSSKLDPLLFGAVVSAGAYVFALLSYSLYVQTHTYAAATQRAISDPSKGDIVLLAYTRAADFAIVKTSVVFLGFILTFVGALYVLRAATSDFSLNVKSGESSGSLATSSPGLVMLTLGVVTVNCAMFARTTVGIDAAAPNHASIEFSSERQTVKAAPGTTPDLQVNRVPLVLPPFPAGAIVLTEAQKNALAVVAKRLAKDPSLRLVISDQADPNESIEMNLSLNARREEAIRAYLGNLGLGDRISVNSIGNEPRIVPPPTG